MEFRVGNIRAQCPGCSGTDFRPPPGQAAAGPHMKYSCTACDASWTYARLIGQIGRETMRRKTDRLSPQESNMTKSVPAFLKRS